MNWKIKSAIQRACASLPVGQEFAYYTIQRSVGRLRHPSDPTELLSESARLARALQEAGRPVAGASLMEVGTGRALDMPIGFYLCGAAEVRTWDLYRLAKSHRIAESLQFIRDHEPHIRTLFAGCTEPAVLEERLAVIRTLRSSRDLFAKTPIHYHAPADASATGLPAGSVDIQTSYTVFEHIPRETLVAILREARRILRPDGAALHHIDLSDHFAHVDPSISFINFLQFTPQEWRKYGSNQFAYHNRLRPPAYREIYDEAGHDVIGWTEAVDARSVRQLQDGFPLAKEFQGLPAETLAVSVLQVLSRGRP